MREEVWGSGDRMVRALVCQQASTGVPWLRGAGQWEDYGKEMGSPPREGLTGGLHSPVAMACRVMELEGKPLRRS